MCHCTVRQGLQVNGEARGGGGGGVSEGDDSHQTITCCFYVMMESEELCVSEEPADTNSKHRKSSLLSATCYM